MTTNGFPLSLRKEVIPYDFLHMVTVALKRLPHRLRVLQTRGVTGGVYKARERIHRGVLIRDY